MRSSLISFFNSVGELGLFGMRAIRDAFRPPFELKEVIEQLYEIGWRSAPLAAMAGFAFGVVLSLETLSSMMSFGAQAMIPESVSLGIFKDTGPTFTAILIAGRVGAGIGAQLAGMRVTEQIDALEALAVNPFKYLVVTRIIACVLAIPVLTLLFDFAGMLGGMASDLISMHMTTSLFVKEAFNAMAWSDFALPTIKTVAFGFIIGTVSCYLGYTATHGAEGVGRASTRSVVFSSLLVIVADVILVKVIMFWFPG